MSKTSDLMRKWQAASDWHSNTRSVVKIANKFGELVNTLTAESDSLSEELLRLYKSLESNEDVEAIECSVMALRNTVKSFVIFQKGMMSRIVEYFDVPSYNTQLVELTEKKKNFTKAQAEYDETVEKTQESIKKKKLDEKMIQESTKELDRLNKVVETNKATFEKRANALLNQHAIVYGRCLLQLMDRLHEFFSQGWEVLGGLTPKLTALEDRLAKQDDGSKEGYLMKKSGFTWTKCYVCLRGSKLTWQSNQSKEPKGVDVKLCTVRVRPGAGEFEVVSPSKERPLTLQADSELDRTAWIESLQHSIATELQTSHKPITKHKKALTERQPTINSISLMPLLQSIEGNLICADCDATDPDWASINLGIVLCLECSGVHRSMGTHISKVRSLTLDTWDPETILLSQRIGNVRSNMFFEAIPPSSVSFVKPAGKVDRDTRIKFIQAKYRDLKFVNDERRGWESGKLLDALSDQTVSGDVQEMIKLVVLGASPNALPPTSGTLPIISATRNGNIFALEVLVQNGADVLAVDSQGWTALHHAAALNLVQVGALLLRRGLSDKSPNVTEIRAAAYQLAMRKSSESMARLLKEDGWATHVARQMLSEASSPVISAATSGAVTPNRARALTRSLSRSSDPALLNPLDISGSPTHRNASPSPLSGMVQPPSFVQLPLQPLETPTVPLSKAQPQSEPYAVPAAGINSPSLAYRHLPFTIEIDEDEKAEKNIIQCTTSIVQLISEMKAQVAQPKFSPSIPLRVEAAIILLERFFKDQKLPYPEVPPVPQASHPLQLQLNKVLGYVSMICKAYQLQPTPSSARLYSTTLKEIFETISENGGDDDEL